MTTTPNAADFTSLDCDQCHKQFGMVKEFDLNGTLFLCTSCHAVLAERERCAAMVAGASFSGDQEEERQSDIEELVARIKSDTTAIAGQIEGWRRIWAERMDRGYFGAITAEEEGNRYLQAVVRSGELVIEDDPNKTHSPENV